jgi:hypothetical protein
MYVAVRRDKAVRQATKAKKSLSKASVVVAAQVEIASIRYDVIAIAVVPEV